MNNQQISDTSSLVILWTEGIIHTSKNAKAYLKFLNLDSGKALLSECNQIWSQYNEVIKNRKKCIWNLVLQDILREKITQVIIFGSGMDTLSIEIASNIKNITIYDIDISQMKLKENLIRKVNGKLNKSIKCITSDLTKPEDVLRNIKKRGWDSRKPSILIFEGISYFLTEKDLWGLVTMFKTKNQKNIILLEYLLHQKNISKNRSNIPELIFNAVKKTNANNKSQITRYEIKKIKGHIDKLNGYIIQRYNMKDMEKDRVGKNIHFKTNKSGWIEISHIVI